MGNIIPGKTADSHGISCCKQRGAGKEGQCINGGGQLLFSPIRGLCQQASDFLPRDAPAEYHKGGQLDQGEPNGCPQDCSQGNVQAVADDPQTGETRRDQADQLGQEDSGGQADGKHEGAVSYILSQKQEKQPGTAHSQHQIHAEFMPAPFQLVFAGKVNQEEQDEQGHPVKQRDHAKQPADGVAFHFHEKFYHILLGQGQNDIKGNYRDEQGSEKQSVFFSAPSAVA